MHFDIIPFSQKLREINYAKAFLALISRKNRPIQKEGEIIWKGFQIVQKGTQYSI